MVVSPSLKLAVQTGEAVRAICSRLGLTVSVQVGCMVLVSPSPKLAVQTSEGHLLPLYSVVVSPSRKLAVQIGEAARAICSRLGLTVSV